jgi:hypothetical protein
MSVFASDSYTWQGRRATGQVLRPRPHSGVRVKVFNGKTPHKVWHFVPLIQQNMAAYRANGDRL